MAPVVHACRADYVTYCNTWNAYKQKRRPRAPVPEREKRVSEATTFPSAFRRVESTGINVGRRKSVQRYRGNRIDSIEIIM